MNIENNTLRLYCLKLKIPFYEITNEQKQFLSNTCGCANLQLAVELSRLWKKFKKYWR